TSRKNYQRASVGSQMGKVSGGDFAGAAVGEPGGEGPEWGSFEVFFNHFFGHAIYSCSSSSRLSQGLSPFFTLSSVREISAVFRLRLQIGQGSLLSWANETIRGDSGIFFCCHFQQSREYQFTFDSTGGGRAKRSGVLVFVEH